MADICRNDKKNANLHKLILIFYVIKVETTIKHILKYAKKVTYEYKLIL